MQQLLFLMCVVHRKTYFIDFYNNKKYIFLNAAITGFGRVMFVLEGAATRYRRSQFYDNPGLFFVQFDKCIYWDEEQRQMLLTEGKKRKL